LSKKVILALAVVAVLAVLSAFTLVTVSKTFQIRPSNFVTLPTTPVSKSGTAVYLGSVTPIVENNLAVGVQGYLHTLSGQPVAGASVYVQYYLEGSYRTQMGVTDSNGFFQIRFPMNWTGWLPLTVFYFGDNQHQGFQQAVSLPGEAL
jgi:hypothetical protein